MVIWIGHSLLIFLSVILQFLPVYSQLYSSVTPTEFAKRVTLQGGAPPSTNATITLDLQEGEHIKLQAGLFSTSSARVNQGTIWLIRGLNGSKKPTLDFTQVVSPSSPAVLIAPGEYDLQLPSS